MRVFKYFLFALALSAPCAQAANLKTCLGSHEVRIDEADASECERIAKKKKLSKREKAQIYLQLAITRASASTLTNIEATRTMNELFRLLEASASADSSFGDVYLAMADYYESRNMHAQILPVLERGLKHVPDDVRILAERAALIASPQAPNETKLVCEQVTGSPNADQGAYLACGQAAQTAGLLDLAEIYFYKAAKDFKPGDDRRFIDIQFGSPATRYADLLFTIGRGKEAADFYENIVTKRQSTSAIEWLILARYHESAGNQEAAAKAYGVIASRTFGNENFTYKLLQIMALARAGKSEESAKLAEGMFESSTKQQVLRLQVKLKNGSQKQLKINGKFDDQTKKALSACINERGCFAGVTGQPI